MLARERVPQVCSVCQWKGDGLDVRNIRELELLGMDVKSVVPSDEGDVLVCSKGNMRPGDWAVYGEWSQGCGIVEKGLFEEVFEIVDQVERGGDE